MSPKIRKNMHYFDVYFSSGVKQILETICIKQYACLVDPLRDLNGFSNVHILMFFDQSPRRNVDHLDLPKVPIATKKEVYFRVLRHEQGPGQAGHPVFPLSIARHSLHFDDLCF